MKKVMFIASMGGHLTELLQMKKLFKYYDYMLVTEKHKSTINLKEEYNAKVQYLLAGTKDHMLKYLFVIPINIIKSVIIMRLKNVKNAKEIIQNSPYVVLEPKTYKGNWSNLFKKKVIYIESFANIETRTLTGRLVYKIADVFIVQWKSLLKLYPNAKYEGWIF